MQCICDSKKLKSSISVVEKAVSQKSSIAVLENIFLELKEGKLTLRGNNLEIGIQDKLDINNAEKDGSILVKAKTLSGIVSKIEDEQLSLSVDDQHKLLIKGKTVDFDILGCNTEDYPVFPNVEEGVQLSLTVQELRDLINHTILSVSYDETKQFLNGILIKSEGDNLVFVATDGYRLALKTQKIPPLAEMLNVIVPHKAFSELGRILTNEDLDSTVQITVSANQIAFRLNNFLLVSRVIQGQFPDYKQVIPDTNAQHAFKINREAFLSASERASVIASVSNNVVRFSFQDNSVGIYSNAKGLGDYKEDIAIERQKGEGDVKVVFNIRLVLDVLKTVSSETVILSFNNEISPCKLSIEGDDTFTYIIMPIRTTDHQD